MGKARFCRWLAVVCLLALTGCSSTPATTSSGVTVPSTDVSAVQSGEELTTFAVGYSKEDTLNPYTTKTEVNLQLAPLLYDSLTVMTEGFTPRVSLAASVDDADATHLVATLRNSARFSDGSRVTTADVTASFRLAKSSTNYTVLLSNVTAAVADTRQGTVTFTLASPDPNARACLSFPILKESSLTNEAGKAPIGGGLYQLTQDDDGPRLTVNKHAGGDPRFTTVYLRHLPNGERLYYGLSSGDITYYYDDLAEGTVPRVTGANIAVDMNALLFVGVRSGHKALSQPTVRRALSDLLDRQAIATATYSGWAIASAQPFHPNWSAMRQIELPSPQRNLDGAVDALQQAGCGADEAPLSLDLIYCTGQSARGAAAELIRSQCEGGGVTINLVPLQYRDYMSRLKSGQYDLYLGEVRLAANMSLQPLLSGNAAYGVNKKGDTAKAYAAYLTGGGSLSDLLATFGTDMPFLPLCWRCGFAAYDRRLSTATPGGYNAYYGFADWK